MFPLKDSIPTRRFPVLTVVIIAACVFVYFFLQGGLWELGDKGNERVLEFGAIPYEITHPGKECFEPAPGVVASDAIVCEGRDGIPDNVPDRFKANPHPVAWYITIFTSMFMHGSLLHLGGNMLFFWIFGNNIEDSMSRWRFALFYVLGGLVAVLGQVVTDPSSAVPTVGASGAIAAVLGAYAVLYPRARVVTLIFIIIFFTVVELPALVVLGLWFLIQLLYGASELGQPLGGGGGVAYFAHIGGFVFGMLLIRLFANNVHQDYDRQQRIPVY